MTWYSDAGTTVISTPTPDTSVAGVTTYYVSQTDANGCESLLSSIDVTINALPSLASGATSYEYCSGDVVPTLSLVSLPYVSIDWYDALTGGNYLSTGSSYSPVSGTSTYYAETRDNTCLLYTSPSPRDA